MAQKTTLSRRAVITLPVALPMTMAACSTGPAIIKSHGTTMGTYYKITAVDHTGKIDRADIQTAIDNALAEVNAQMSNWDPGSEISRFNQSAQADGVRVSPALANVLAAAGEVHSASGGQFDITLDPLIELWGFGASGSGNHTPDEQSIAAALELTGQNRVLDIQGDKVRKLVAGSGIHLSAIGKGYGVDRVAMALEDLGLEDYLVEIGGDLYAAGANPSGQPWRIGIEAPDIQDTKPQSIVSVSGYGMATSGDYRNYFEQDGQRYSHILDVHTGRPVTHKTASATVLTKDAMRADAWATAMLVLGRERGFKIAEAHGLAVLFVERGDQSQDAHFVATPTSQFAQLQA